MVALGFHDYHSTPYANLSVNTSFNYVLSYSMKHSSPLLTHISILSLSERVQLYNNELQSSIFFFLIGTVGLLKKVTCFWAICMSVSEEKINDAN